MRPQLDRTPTSPIAALRGALFAALALMMLTTAGCSKGGSNPDAKKAGGQAVVASGEDLFNRNCARCHGAKASGSSYGPPLVHKIYEPGHHADAAFYRAVQGGVKAHHWRFGNMPRVGGVSNEEVGSIVSYIRGLQREAGIF